jgi:lipoate-protein ligase A
MTSFRLLDLTLPSPVENLALDEALLEEAEQRQSDPVLRFWESDRHVVVLGRSSRLTDDVHLDACQADGVPILRRASGGGTVLQGPGCLSYAFVMPLKMSADLRDIRSSNTFILHRLAHALSQWQPRTAVQGISDLAIDGRKISGNAQRRTRNALLFHGTILYRMDAEVIARYLKQPKRQPQYRSDRSHREFLRTIDVPAEDLKKAIADAWHAHIKLRSWPRDRMTDTIVTVLERSSFQEEHAGEVHASSADRVLRPRQRER